jgi:hypothetical protein
MMPTPPYSPHPLLPVPPMPDDVVKTIRKHVDDRLDEVMAGKDEKLYHEFEKYICHILEKHKKTCYKHDDDESLTYKKSPMEALYCTLHKHQKSIHEGKSIMELEHEVWKEHDLCPEEKRVLASLLRADGPYTLAGMIGMPYETYIEFMGKLGERFVD